MQRIDHILSLVQKHKYITPSMVAYYYRFPSGHNKAQQIMGKMAKDNLINRFRIGRKEYIYHQGQRSTKWRHWLKLSWFHFVLLNELKSWQKILFWQTEVKYPFGIADGFYMVQTTIDGAGVMFFLEIDNGNNSFDKVEKYLAYYQGGAWANEWWGQSFPLVLVITPQAGLIQSTANKSEKGKALFRIIEDPNDGILKSLLRESDKGGVSCEGF